MERTKTIKYTYQWERATGGEIYPEHMTALEHIADEQIALSISEGDTGGELNKRLYISEEPYDFVSYVGRWESKISSTAELTPMSCTFIGASSLVPDSWRSWFWDSVSGDSPFCWGGNNRSLVSPGSFADHCKDCLSGILDDLEVSQNDFEAFIEEIRSLEVEYIDLEN